MWHSCAKPFLKYNFINHTNSSFLNMAATFNISNGLYNYKAFFFFVRTKWKIKLCYSVALLVKTKGEEN